MRTALYRFYDDENALLYVGITKNIKSRFYSHARDKEWWPEVARKAVEWHDTREQALAAEREAIRAETARYNNCFQVGRLPLSEESDLDSNWEPVTLSAIARMLGVTYETARQWNRYRLIAKEIEPFPEPYDKVGRSDRWRSNEVLDWARRTGRLKQPEVGGE